MTAINKPVADEADYSSGDKHADIKILHAMGYAQELERRMSRFSNFAICFSIICILSGGINSLAQATAGAGGAAIGIGWPLGCVISGVFALAMAQIGSAYPDGRRPLSLGLDPGQPVRRLADGLVQPAGPRDRARRHQRGDLLLLLRRLRPGAGHARTRLTVRILFVAVLTAIQALINHVGIGLTAKLTDLSGYLIFASAIVLTLVCLIFAPSHDFGRLFTFTNYSGDPGGRRLAAGRRTAWAFLLGLLLPIYTITGYDASAHTSEETRDARALGAERHGHVGRLVGHRSAG